MLTLEDLREHLEAGGMGLIPVSFKIYMVAGTSNQVTSFALCAHSITSILKESSKLVDYTVVI